MDNKELLETIALSKFERFKKVKELIYIRHHSIQILENLEVECELLQVEIEYLISKYYDETYVIHFNMKYKNWELIPRWKVKDGKN